MIKTKNPRTMFEDFSTRFSGSENSPIIAQAMGRKQLNRERLCILSELEQLAGVPRAEQRSRYYRIKPRSKDVFMELAKINGTSN